MVSGSDHFFGRESPAVDRFHAGVAQRKCNAFVKRRSGVRSSPPARTIAAAVRGALPKISKTTPCKVAGHRRRSPKQLDMSGKSGAFFDYSEILCASIAPQQRGASVAIASERSSFRSTSPTGRGDGLRLRALAVRIRRGAPELQLHHRQCPRDVRVAQSVEAALSNGARSRFESVHGHQACVAQPVEAQP